MKKILTLIIFSFLFNLSGNSQIKLSNNVGDDVKFKGMFSCEQTEWWAREFILSDFGITENQEFIISSGKIAINYSYNGASFQFNIFEIDDNFPSSFNESKLIGSSQIETLPSVYGLKPKFVEMQFDNPIIVSANVKKILIEVKKTVTPRNPAIAIATIAGTDKDRGFSWYKGCLNIGNGTGYQATTNFSGTLKRPDARFYITVNGQAKTILPFEITNDNNCENQINNFSLTNQSEIKSVVWNFDDPTSGANNTSKLINLNHQFSSSGIYNVTAEVIHTDGTSYTIPKEIEIFEVPIINKNVSLKQCDNSDINGFSFFNLNEVKEKIIANPENYTITFYEEKALAENKGIAITNITKYENEQVSVDKVWARVENSNGCYRVSEVNLFVSTTQIPATLLKSFYQCDDGTSTTDGIATFDFSSVTTDIVNIFPVGQQLIINYYRNEDDALSEENAIDDIKNYQNIGYKNQQNIYIRVDSKVDNDCLGLGAHISLNVEKVPVANSVTISPECDNDRDGFFSFNTSTIQKTLIDNQTNIDVSYFNENGVQLTSPLPNPFITDSQTITAIVTNSNSQDPDGKCSSETNISFIVNSVPIANPVSVQENCDDDNDGIIEFNTSIIESTVLGGQTGLIIKYFDEDNNALPSPLPNPFFTTSQNITVRLESPEYDICYDDTTISFIVREKPDFNILDEAIICMTLNPNLELFTENPIDNNYTYTWWDKNNTIISNNPTAEVTKGGVYKVRATSIFGCNSDTKEITVRESSISTININDIEVIDDSENNSIRINTSNLGLGNYEFRLLDNTLTVIRNYQDEPYFDNLDGGVYTVEVNDKDGCGVVLLELSLLSFPNFFTPNNDGTNDYWQINGISKSFYKIGKISIFDRYGKLLAVFTIDDIGWNGTYNGKILPSNDYWFYVELLDLRDLPRIKTGNFSLLRK